VINCNPSSVGRKSLVNFGPLTKKFHCLISTYPKSTVRVLRMLMHLTFGHVTSLAGEFHPPHTEISPNRTYGTGWTHVGLCPKFVVFFNFLLHSTADQLEWFCGVRIPTKKQPPVAGSVMASSIPEEDPFLGAAGDHAAGQPIISQRQMSLQGAPASRRSALTSLQIFKWLKVKGRV